MFQVFIQRNRSTKYIIIINIPHPNKYLQLSYCDVILNAFILLNYICLYKQDAVL